MNIQLKIQQFLDTAVNTVLARIDGEWDSVDQPALVTLLDSIYPLWRDYLDELSPPVDDGYDLVLDYRPRTKRMVAKCSVHGLLPIIKHEDDRVQYDLTILDAWLHQRNCHGLIGLPEFDLLSYGDRWHDAISYAMSQPIGTVITLQSDSR